MTQPIKLTINNTDVTILKLIGKILFLLLLLPFHTVFIVLGMIAGSAWGNILSGWDRTALIIKWGWHDNKG